MPAGQSALLVVLAFATLVAANIPLPIPRVEDIPQDVETRADPVNYRLPNNTRPVSYDVHLITHVHTQVNFSFSGVVAIRLNVVNVSRTITLHHRQLTIGNASIVLAGGGAAGPQIMILSTVYDATNEFLTFTVDTDLSANTEYDLTILFSGILRDDDAGFYRSSYMAADGTTRWLATTQFEQTDARHAFPCYDEPALRALYTIKITHGSAYHAISNMPVATAVPDSLTGYTTTTFQVTSAPTPSYLIAFIVSDFASKSLTNSNGFVQRIFTRPNAIDDGDFGLEFGVKSLDAFVSYFGIPFALPKMDQAAVPDFAAGAMENWGLVTYREDYLLYNPNRSTFTNRFNVATTIAHEYAHQWFGNLVTPKWWTYIWLNEGFATLFENYGTDWVYPEWKILDAFVYSPLQSVMISDATSATRPMTHYVESDAAISRLFDNIAYSKSGCVLRMFLNAFTEASFKKGLITYLNAKANTNATEEDLFAALETAVRADSTLNAAYNVETIFSSWTRQAGFPIVTVTRDYGGDQIVLSQERYLTVNESTQSPSLWWIPYNVASGAGFDFSSTAATSWFSTRTANITESNLKSTDWLLLNKRQTGYYRVKYDSENYKLLSEALVQNLSQIHLASRSQLIDDAFDLARTERLSYNVALDFTKFLQHELEYVPWASAFRGLTLVDRLYAGNTDYAKFKSYMLKLLSHIYQDAGLVAAADEHHFRKQARNQVIQWACRLGSALCLDNTNTAVNQYLVNNVAIHQDHRAAILCNGIRNATIEQYVLLIARLPAADSLDRNRIIDALACTSNMTFANQYLQASVGEDTSFLASQAERYRAFSEVAGISQNSTKLAITFLKDNLDAANTSYGQTNVNSAIIRLANFVVSAERTTEFNSLLNSAVSKSFINAATISSASAIVEANKRWIDRNEKDINEWVNQNGSAHVVGSAILLAIMLSISQFSIIL